MEHVRGSPKLNMFCTLSIKKVYVLLFFNERKINHALQH